MTDNEHPRRRGKRFVQEVEKLLRVMAGRQRLGLDDFATEAGAGGHDFRGVASTNEGASEHAIESYAESAHPGGGLLRKADTLASQDAVPIDVITRCVARDGLSVTEHV